MAASERFQAIISFFSLFSFFFFASLNFLNFYNEHELSEKKNKKKTKNIFKLLKRNPKVLRMEFEHDVAWLYSGLIMPFCVIPSRYDLHFNQSQNAVASRRV